MKPCMSMYRPGLTEINMATSTVPLITGLPMPKVQPFQNFLTSFSRYRKAVTYWTWKGETATSMLPGSEPAGRTRFSVHPTITTTILPFQGEARTPGMRSEERRVGKEGREEGRSTDERTK